MNRAESEDSGKGWHECASWLTRCEALRPDHKANWPQATAFDLAYTLRDGVLLCNLLNIVDPGCIDMKDVNQKPQMAQFLCLRNIKVFLTACSSVFSLSDSELFEPSMLFDLSNFHRVLCTLSSLSNCPRLRRKGIAWVPCRFLYFCISLLEFVIKQILIIRERIKNDKEIFLICLYSGFSVGHGRSQEDIYKDLQSAGAG